MLRRWLPLLAVVALLAAAFAAAVFAEPQLGLAPPPGPQEDGRGVVLPSGTATPSVPAEEPSAQPRSPLFVLPSWLNGVLTVACMVGVAMVVGMLLWYVIRDTAQARGRPITVDQGAAALPAARADEVAAALDTGLSELADPATDPRRTVIACWVRLEQSAATAGTPRRVSDSPTDHVLRLLAAHRVSRPVLDRFAEVYRQARYGTAAVDESMRATALAALGQLRSELTDGTDRVRA